MSAERISVESGAYEASAGGRGRSHSGTCSTGCPASCSCRCHDRLPITIGLVTTCCGRDADDPRPHGLGRCYGPRWIGSLRVLAQGGAR